MGMGDTSEQSEPSAGGETVWVPADFIVRDRVRAYHWTDDCVRAPERSDMVQVPVEAAAANPKLRACRVCAPRGGPGG